MNMLSEPWFKTGILRLYTLLPAALCGILLLYACDFPGSSVGGESYLTINLPGDPADSSRAVISNAAVAALEYKITFTGPGGTVLTKIIPPGSGSFSLALTPGTWSIAAEAYDPPGVMGGALVGTGTASAALARGQSVTVPIAMTVTSAYEAGLTTVYIHNEGDLRRIGTDLPIDGSTVTTFVLENDITLTQPWTAIGSYTAPFKADFDGGEHTITITSFDDPVEDAPYLFQGFFAGVEDAEIKDLTIRYDLSGPVNMITGDPTLTRPAAGGIAGIAFDTVFQDITVQVLHGFSVIGDGSSGLTVGGIVGYGSDTTIGDCRVSGAIGGNSASNLYIGGIGGTIDCSTVYTVTKSSFTGNIDGVSNGAGASCKAGGITGQMDNHSKISECYAVGWIEGEGDHSLTGGIAGIINNNTGMVEKSYASGVINGTGTGSISAIAGGIAGASRGTIENCGVWAYVETQIPSGSSVAGGIVGDLDSGATLSACYALGTVKAGGVSPAVRYAGGLAGLLDGSGNTVASCVALNQRIEAPVPNNAAGSIAGEETSASNTYTSNYAASDITFDPSETAAGNLTGISTSRAAFVGQANQAIYPGWTFGIGGWKWWTDEAAYPYPILHWQAAPPADPGTLPPP